MANAATIHMATWHQQKRPVQMYHDTEWTVVEDPHGGCRTLSTFARERDARDYLGRVVALRPNVPAYVLEPAGTSVAQAFKGGCE